MLDGTWPVDDAEPQQARVDAVELQAELGVDLREMGEVALASVGMVEVHVALEVGTVDVQRAAERDRRPARVAHRLGDDARADEVCLLGVAGVAPGERPARLGGQVDDAIGSQRQHPVDVVAPAHVDVLDLGA